MNLMRRYKKTLSDGTEDCNFKSEYNRKSKIRDAYQNFLLFQNVPRYDGISWFNWIMSLPLNKLRLKHTPYAL